MRPGGREKEVADYVYGILVDSGRCFPLVGDIDPGTYEHLVCGRVFGSSHRRGTGPAIFRAVDPGRGSFLCRFCICKDVNQKISEQQDRKDQCREPDWEDRYC